MSEPEKVDASSQPCTTGMQQQSYKCLLNQHVQKLKKQLPLYQTQNEGFEHQPKLRTTVWVDGVSYTSPSTFQQHSETGNILSEIIKSKFNHPVPKDTQIAQNVTNVANGLALSEAKGDEVTKMPFTEPVNTTTSPALNPPVDITQTHTEETPTIPVSTVLTQTPFTVTNNVPSMNSHVDITQTHVPQISTQVPIQTPSLETNTAATYSEPSVGHFSSIPTTHLSNVVQQATTIPVTHIVEISTQTYPMPTLTPTQTVSKPTVMAQAPPTHTPTQTVSMPTVMAQTPFSGTNNAPISTSPSSRHISDISATHHSFGWSIPHHQLYQLFMKLPFGYDNF